MNSLSLILRILAIVAALAAGALFFVSKGKLAEEQAARVKAEQATTAVQAELATANEQNENLEARLTTERETLAETKRNLESIRSEMYTARQEVSRTQQQLSETKKTINELKDTSERLRSDLLKSEQSLAAASKEGEIAQYKERIAELEETAADLKESLEDAKQAAARAASSGSSKTGGAQSGSYTSTFSPTQSAPLPTASLGADTTIQSISAETGLIVLSNSEELALTPGVEVTVIKDMKALGKIRISQVNGNIAVANILPGAQTRAMSAGSTVKLLR